ncbi:serine/threonine protein kinase containing TPR domain [Calothrix brevissima NIES-22]|nr:serine/threonine protein kinase containing TPR domain [Calothrix brevissima NIES-22]
MQVGEILRDRYKIISHLGQGAFGETYLAEDLGIPINPKPKCVVKRLKTQNFTDAQLDWVKNAFEQEAATLYNLGRLHPQIPSLSEYFQVEREFYLVQDFIDGVDLTKIINPGNKLAEKVVIQLLTEILEVLTVVHQQNIIHRDIKPQNIMRRRIDGKIVLIDFGAVKQIMLKNAGQSTLTMGVGTPGFMPLEQFNGKPKLASDIYAVGMVGVQALTGIPPHLLDDDEDGEVIWQDRANVSDRFAALLKTMINRRVSQRYQNATEALEAMQLLNEPIVPTILSPSSPSEENQETQNSQPLQQTLQPQRGTFSSKITGLFNIFNKQITPNVGNTVQAKDADTYKKEGKEKYDRGDYQGAIEDYNQAIKIHPDYADAYNNRGNAREKLGDYQGAIEDYNQAIKIHPDYADAYCDRGNARGNLGEYQAAIEDYNRAIKINPDDADAYCNRGNARWDLGEYQAAIEDYNRAIKINPDYADAYNNRGNARWDLGEYQAAIKDYNQAIKINPDYADAYINRGLAREKLGEYQTAIKDYNQAIKINPDYADAYINRGNARGNLGEYQAAIKDYNRAIKINPDDAIAYINRGVAHYDLGKYPAAIEDYNRAIKINPDNADAYYNRGLALKNLGEYQTAIEDYNRAIKINPDYADAYNNRGIVRKNLGEYQAAIEDYEQAANLYKQQGKESYYEDALNQISALREII